MALDP